MKMKENNLVEEKERQYALFKIYGGLLSSRQKEDLENYLGFDLSLSEISNELGVSKSAVSDSIHKAISNLEYFEDILGLYKKRLDVNAAIDSIMAVEDEMARLKLFESLGRVIKDGI